MMIATFTVVWEPAHERIETATQVLDTAVNEKLPDANFQISSASDTYYPGELFKDAEVDPDLPRISRVVTYTRK